MKRFILLTLALLTLLVFMPIWQFTVGEQSSMTETPYVQMTIQPSPTDTPSDYSLSATPTISDDNQKLSDNDLVVQTLEKACQIEEDAIWTFDTSEFSTVYVNDPRFPVPPDTLRFVQLITNDTSITYVGYLDFSLAVLRYLQDGVVKWKAVSERMKAENRNEMTDGERNSLMSPTGNMYPAPPSPEIKGNVPCIYAVQSINIVGDIATVVASRGATTDEWHLVNRDGQWYIAGRKILIMHP